MTACSSIGRSSPRARSWSRKRPLWPAAQNPKLRKMLTADGLRPRKDAAAEMMKPEAEPFDT